MIGDGPDRGAAVKVLDRSGRKVRLAILTNLSVQRCLFGIAPPAFAPGIVLAHRSPPPVPNNALGCAAG